MIPVWKHVDQSQTIERDLKVFRRLIATHRYMWAKAVEVILGVIESAAMLQDKCCDIAMKRL